MFDYETTVAEIERKVRKLIEENDRLRASEQNLTRQCKELQEQIDNNNVVINKLKEQNNILKLGNTLTQKGDSAEIKLKINQLIRSIDKSLSLINKSE
jgi:predicted RNase H-like nuclease (RuvC/YqgF family)